MNLDPMLSLESALSEFISAAVPILIGLGVLAAFCAVLTNRMKAVLPVFVMIMMLSSFPTICSFLGMEPSAIRAVDPFAWLGRHLTLILIGAAIAFTSSAVAFVGRQLYKRRALYLALEQARQAEASIRFEYAQWLEEEALKLDIEVLSAPNDQQLLKLRERVEEARHQNSICSPPRQPVLPGQIKQEWDKLGSALDDHWANETAGKRARRSLT